MATEKQVEEKILSLISELAPAKNKSLKITSDTLLQRELGVNSISLLSFVFRFEEEFDVDVSHLDLGRELPFLKSVGDLLRVGKELAVTGRARVS